jgi:hypothetical protein
MTREFWTWVAAVGGGLVALEEVYRRVVLPLWRYARRTARRLNILADELLGDEAKGIPSATQRLTRVERALDRHERWHADPQGQPAKGSQQRPNGGIRPTRKGRPQPQARGDVDNG